MLRGINVGGHNQIKMDDLRGLYGSLKLRGARTLVQSGNVVFRADEGDPAPLAARIEKAIERQFGFRPAVIVRTPAELRETIAQNPFAAREGIDPSRLLVTFLASEPAPEAREKVLRMEIAPEELRLRGRELYIYYPHGQARPKVPWTSIEKTLQVAGTGRNWNTVTKLLEMAEELEAS